MNALYYDILSSDFGALIITSSDRGLRFIQYYDTQAAARADTWLTLTTAQRDTERMRPYLEAVIAFLNGQTRELDLPLDLEGGTELQSRVWQELCQIPYGATISYSDLAARVSHPDAIRAVASACGKNPLPLIIPCHRVVAKDGSLGGFTWGLDKKQQLLEMERTACS